MNMKDVSCPECGHRLKLGNHLHKGQRVTCPDCESKLVVVSLKPVELDSALLVNRSTRVTKKSHTIEALCPECDSLIKLNTHNVLGYRLKCSSCNTLLEVVDTNPFELDVAFDSNIRPADPKKFGKEKW